MYTYLYLQQECKALFEELSGIMRTVLASRSEIVEYDRRQQLSVNGDMVADPKKRVSCHSFVSFAFKISFSQRERYGEEIFGDLGVSGYLFIEINRHTYC